jgi:hypothetical protein
MKRMTFWGVVALVLVLAALPGTTQALELSITTIPPGAQVWINGLNTGKITPTSIYAMNMGMGGQILNVKIVIPNSVFEPYETTVIPDRDTIDLKVDFTSKRQK